MKSAKKPWTNIYSVESCNREKYLTRQVSTGRSLLPCVIATIALWLLFYQGWALVFSELVCFWLCWELVAMHKWMNLLQGYHALWWQSLYPCCSISFTVDWLIHTTAWIKTFSQPWNSLVCAYPECQKKWEISVAAWQNNAPWSSIERLHPEFTNW